MIQLTKDQVVAARLAAELTQTKAAALVGASLRAWQDWESGDRGSTLDCGCCSSCSPLSTEI